jgi:hypothetical protein
MSSVSPSTNLVARPQGLVPFILGNRAIAEHSSDRAEHGDHETCDVHPMRLYGSFAAFSG